MVENNFPKMRDYFFLSKDFPYRYRIHLEFKDGDGRFSEPSIKYYRVSIEPNESDIPEVIVQNSDTEIKDDDIFKIIRQSFHEKGKESKSQTITTSGFTMTLLSRRSGENTPLTDVVYEDFKEAFKKLFG